MRSRRNALLCALSISFLSTALIGQSQAFAPLSSKGKHPSCINKAHQPLPNRSLALEATKSPSPLDKITDNPKRSLLFSLSQTTAGALLGPFLDSYHSANGVLQYDSPFSAQLWSTNSIPALTTTWWVPPLFGFAGFLIGWLYILLDDYFGEGEGCTPMGTPGPVILSGIALFTFQYWLSGIFFAYGLDRTAIFGIMSAVAFWGFYKLDGTKSGLFTSLATAIGGPLIEIGLITLLAGTNGGYHYTDPGETGLFPLWIVPLYFLGGPANGNLARGVWNSLGKVVVAEAEEKPRRGCRSCSDTRVVSCPNCDGVGYYMTYGTEVKCNCCKSRGLVICRECFDWYDEDPADIGRIREFMSRIPD